MAERRKPRVSSGEIIVLIFIGVISLVVITGNGPRIIGFFTESFTQFIQFATVIAAVMIVEYLLLKGSDRSAIYRRERDAAREIRRDDLLAMREMEKELVDLRARLNVALEKDPEDQSPLRPPMENAQSVCGRMIELIRKRI